MERYANCNKREESHKQTCRRQDPNMRGNKGLHAMGGQLIRAGYQAHDHRTDSMEHRYTSHIA